MSKLTIDVLKKIIENVPGDYDVGYSSETANVSINTIEIDIADKRIVFK